MNDDDDDDGIASKRLDVSSRASTAGLQFSNFSALGDNPMKVTSNSGVKYQRVKNLFYTNKGPFTRIVERGGARSGAHWRQCERRR